MCDVVRPGGLDALKPDDRAVAERFMGVLGGCRRVLDVGCGSGFPGLYVAPHVGELVGMDAAPNMIAAARANALMLGVGNVRFEVGGVGGLQLGDEEFDGALLCGVLESMDWDSVARIMSDVWRTLASGGRIAVLDQDWNDVLRSRPLTETSVSLRRGDPILRFVERFSAPGLERDFRYLIDPKGSLAAQARAGLGDQKCASIRLTRADVPLEEVVDAWYDEVAQFDERALQNLANAADFRDISVLLMPVWGQQVLFMTATK